MRKILIVHNIYQQKGGEDSVVANEAALLRKFGNQVEVYLRHNDDIVGQSKMSLLSQAVYSKKSYSDISAKIKEFKPDIVHVHNTLPLVSPSVFWAAHHSKVAVVQTLHNFRLFCPQATFLRKGKICEDCLGKIPWRGILHRCYRQSFTQTAALTGVLLAHRALGTYRKKVDAFIALNHFSKTKYIQGGMRADNIFIKPNFAEDWGLTAKPRDGFLYVGRLSVEKGARIFASAFNPDQHGFLNIVGDGDERIYLENINHLSLLGALSQQDVRLLMQSCLALVLPSICYENMPMTLVEAYSSGLPVIASRLGSLCHLVEDGVTGLLFNAGDASDLAEKMSWAKAHPDAMAKMGRNARARYLAEYTPEKNYEILMNIYDEALLSCQK
ncbi:glycosyltransferase family 4 protein [Iodobacter sp. HSC-16F04]|uniref:Glycosyltransferase family 4 protein n=1 Tax=Iodobacter violaceini TaxID=3044271 RepID=A0ABX0KTY1_9NEIS|nr:glycosyltransferase family 4 protein [Iodobacter violacea]NHQ85927.1 glycosyltransferase family 4 protein [Iodobacter violacea]